AAVSLTVNDLGNFGTGGALNANTSVAVDVTAVNDAPTPVAPAAQSTPEDAPLIFRTSNGNAISVSDVDDADNGTQGDETVQVTLSAVNGALTLSATAGLSFTFVDANGIGAGDGTADNTMTFRGSLANVNAALEGMSFL